jgi:hypothetical protein
MSTLAHCPAPVSRAGSPPITRHSFENRPACAVCCRTRPHPFCFVCVPYLVRLACGDKLLASIGAGPARSILFCLPSTPTLRVSRDPSTPSHIPHTPPRSLESSPEARGRRQLKRALCWREPRTRLGRQHFTLASSSTRHMRDCLPRGGLPVVSLSTGPHKGGIEFWIPKILL